VYTQLICLLHALQGGLVPVEKDYLQVPVNPDSDMPLYVRAGHIFPMQEPALNTVAR